MKFNKGKIIGFYGSWLSGIAQLIVETKDGKREEIPCDNAPTVRALDHYFDGFISKGHTVNNEAIKGKEIIYRMDDMGLVLGMILPINYCDYCLGKIDCKDCQIEIE